MRRCVSGLIMLIIILQLLLPACTRQPAQSDVQTLSPSTAAESQPLTEATEQPTTQIATTEPQTTQSATELPSTEGAQLYDETTQETTTQAESTTGEIANEPMSKLMDEFGDIVLLCGFEYDEQNDLFFSTKYPLQRYFGYNSLYDVMAYRFGMYYNTQKIYFEYDDMDWMLQLWKGQYGITVGAEIGLYNKPSDRLFGHYNSVDDEDMIEMEFDVYKNGEYYFSRGPEKHWWLTGFKLLDVAIFLQLKMVITLYWENDEIADAFEEGINNFHISDMSYVRDGNTFVIDWTI